MSQFTTHGFSCRKSAGHHHRHSAVNDIIHRALVAAHVPSRLEPSGLYRSDAWYINCPMEVWPTSSVGCNVYRYFCTILLHNCCNTSEHLDSCHFFIPVAIETTGVFGPRTTEFLKELGCRLRQVFGEANSSAYLTQRLSVAVQRGNAASVLGTMKVHSEDE